MAAEEHARARASWPGASLAPARRYTVGRAAFRWLPALLIVLALLGIWEGYVRLFHVQKWLLPAPSVIASTLGSDIGLLSRHTWVTLEEVLIGFGFALVAGMVLAAAIALSRTLERALYPFVVASQTIPIIVIAPLLLIWVGYGLWPKVIVVALIAFFPIVVNTVDGLRAVDPDMVNLLRTLRASRWQIFAKLQVPSALPFLFSGVKVAIAVSVIGAVIGEWVGSSEGLGYLMVRSKPQFLTERVFAAMVILSVMGVALFVLAGAVERLALPWSHARRAQRALEGEQGGRKPQISRKGV